MKTLVCLVLASAALASATVSLAQSTAPVTRAQVRAELIRLEQAGYHVGDGNDTTYPAKIQVAEANIAAQDSQQATSNAAQDNQQAAENAVGGTTTGTSDAGSSQHASKSSPSPCVGPASYCNIFFGHH